MIEQNGKSGKDRHRFDVPGLMIKQRDFVFDKMVSRVGFEPTTY